MLQAPQLAFSAWMLIGEEAGEGVTWVIGLRIVAVNTRIIVRSGALTSLCAFAVQPEKDDKQVQ